jgi:hypothetical protein
MIFYRYTRSREYSKRGHIQSDHERVSFRCDIMSLVNGIDGLTRIAGEAISAVVGGLGVIPSESPHFVE